MSAAKVLFFSLLFCLLSAHGVQSTIECSTQNCTEEEECLNEMETDNSPTGKCGFVVVLEENCSFKEALGGSYEKTKEYIDNLRNSSSNKLNYIGYVTRELIANRFDAEHFFIVSSKADESSKWKLDERLGNSSGCTDDINKILCTLLRDPDNYVNKTMCPDPTTTTVLETTEGRTAFTNKAVSAAPARIETVPGTTNDRTVFTNETGSAALSKKEASSIDETINSYATKVGIYIPIAVAMYFYQ